MNFCLGQAVVQVPVRQLGITAATGLLQQLRFQHQMQDVDERDRHAHKPQPAPQGQPQPQRIHVASSLRAKPTPRTVWISGGRPGRSIFRRSRLM